MEWYHYLIIITFTILVLILITTYISFRITFYANRKKVKSDEFTLPPDPIYQTHKERILEAYNKAKTLNYIEMEITSFDGLKLKGKYFECAKNAPIEIMFHGYRGDSLSDLSVGIERCFKLNRNCLLVDQRASGNSEGKVISFGINESKDCLLWINKVIETFGNDVKIILTGISMGATTVVITSGKKLPKNVVGILADCGFHSAKEIIKKTIKEMHLPVKIFYPFVKLAAKIFGHFNLEETSAINEVKKSTVPIIFFHGLNDTIVPHYMSKAMYDACNTRKQLVSIKDAGHGLAYIIEPDLYLNELDNFFKDDLN